MRKEGADCDCEYGFDDDGFANVGWDMLSGGIIYGGRIIGYTLHRRVVLAL